MTECVQESNLSEAFEKVNASTISSLGLTVTEYRHKLTKAMHIHLASEDDENVFMVAFRTMPMDDTGVAHILEHTALCGSQRYPVRDPFFMMIRRSLNTFMNAFTSSDWTAYPFASKNKKDFENLLGVYLDAAFFSRLDPLDFAQEGHRMAFSDPKNPESDLVYQGVVFNEMKGAMSSPESQLWHRLSQHLFPSTTYQYNSGGEPSAIPSLAYEDLKAFYKSHYHPSNAVFLTYGDLPAEWHHSRIQQLALAQFEKGDTDIAVSKAKRHISPQRITEHYALEETSQKTYHVLAWLLGDVTDLHGVLDAYFLSRLLLDHSASPLMHALETTQLGTGPAPMDGVIDTTREIAFACGIEGSDPEHAEALESLVLSTLKTVQKNGVDQATCESVLRQLELEQREVGGAGYPYGLQLCLRALTPAIHRADPIAYLDMDTALVGMREKIKDKQFIPQLIEQLLLNNSHRILLTLAPDSTLADTMIKQEKKQLADAKEAMTEAQKKALIAQNTALDARQKQAEDMEILPKVTPQDVPESWHMAKGNTHAKGEQFVHTYAQPCNGLIYQDIVMPLSESAHWRYLPWFNACLTELGCGDDDYQAMQIKQYRASGGVGTSISFVADLDDPQILKGYFSLTGKALKSQNKSLAELMWTMLSKTRFDENARIKDMLHQYAESKRRSITGSGHSLAMLAAGSVHCMAANVEHQLFGLAGIAQTLNQLERIDDNQQGLREAFEVLHQDLLKAERASLLIADEADLYQAADEVISSMPASSKTPWSVWGSETLMVPPMQQLWVVDTQVNFCAKAYPTVGMTHPDAAVLSVLALILRNGYCHGAIREQGGAYGGGAVHSAGHHSLRFYSYRDPRLLETLDDFDLAVDWLLQQDWPESLLEEAILGVISQIDKPSSPSGEARRAFYHEYEGVTEAMLQQHRARVLHVDCDAIQRVAKTYLCPEKASTAVITNARTLDTLRDTEFLANATVFDLKGSDTSA